MTMLEQDGDVVQALRPRYREAQVLTLADLTDEQTARIQAARRHLLTQHTWGVTDGFQVTGGAQVTIAPGHAIDGIGRRLELTEPWILHDQAVDADVTTVDLWLSAVESCSPARILEETVVTWTPAGRGGGGHPDEPAVEVAGLAGGDAPAWPVFLGRATRDPVTRTFSLVPEQAVDDAGLVGQEIVAAGGGRITLGSEPVDPAVGVTLADPPADGTTSSRERLRVRRTGSRLTANTTVSGSATLEGLGTAVAWSAPVSEAEPRPWALYRHRTPAQEADPPTPARPELEELRLELPATSGLSSSAGWMVVSTAGGGQSVPPLAVSADGTVRMRYLTPGRVLVAPASADMSDPRFRQAVEDAWIDEIVRVSDRIYQRFALDTDHPAPLEVSTEDLPAGQARAGTSVAPDLTLQNIGQDDVNQIRVVRSIQLDGAAPGVPEVIATVDSLTGQQIRTQPQPPHAIPADAAGRTLILSLSAFGLRPSGGVVWATQTRSWTVGPALPPGTGGGGEFQI